MRYTVKTKDCHLNVRARAWFGEPIDEISLNTFSRVCLDGFLKPRVVRRGVVDYTGPVGVSLYDRLQKPIGKRDFLLILEQIVAAVQKINAHRLALDNVILDIHYAFINEITKEVQLLYVPCNKSLAPGEINRFIESIAYSAIPASENDAELISRFVYFFKEQKVFDPDKVERFIGKEDRSVVNTLKKNTKESGFMTDKPQHYYAHYNGGDSDSDATGLLEEDEATGLLEEETSYLDEGTDLLVEEETGLLVEDEEEGTALLAENQEIHYPTLFRLSTEETISINKPVFRLGKERSYVDYFVSNNNAVSRSHADIITRSNKYFVIDLNSKNHTYLNFQMLPVQVETEIQDGDRLKLGNEEFVFNI